MLRHSMPFSISGDIRLGGTFPTKLLAQQAGMNELPTKGVVCPFVGSI